MTKLYTSGNQTITGVKTFAGLLPAILFVDTGCYITRTLNDLIFYDPNVGTPKTLTELASGGALIDHQHSGAGDGGDQLTGVSIEFDYNAEIYATTQRLRLYGVYYSGWQKIHMWDDVTIEHNLTVLGTKSAVVPIGDINCKLYAIESPEVWFEDFGSSKLISGEKRIDIDSMFLQTVIINENNTFKIFIQSTSECNNLYVEKYDAYFIVKESNSGTSNATFDYRIIAKRKEYESKRFEVEEVVDDDIPEEPT